VCVCVFVCAEHLFTFCCSLLLNVFVLCEFTYMIYIIAPNRQCHFDRHSILKLLPASAADAKDMKSTKKKDCWLNICIYSSLQAAAASKAAAALELLHKVNEIMLLQDHFNAMLCFAMRINICTTISILSI